MNSLILLIAQGRGEDPDGGAGVVLIVALVLLTVATIAAVWTLVARRSRRSEDRLGPDEKPHEPGHGGRVSGMETDRPRR